MEIETIFFLNCFRFYFQSNSVSVLVRFLFSTVIFIYAMFLLPKTKRNNIISVTNREVSISVTNREISFSVSYLVFISIMFPFPSIHFLFLVLFYSVIWFPFHFFPLFFLHGRKKDEICLSETDSSFSLEKLKNQ